MNTVVNDLTYYGGLGILWAWLVASGAPFLSMLVVLAAAVSIGVQYLMETRP